MPIFIGIVCIIIVLASVSVLVDDPFGATTRVQIQADAMVKIARINALSKVASHAIDQFSVLLVLSGLGLILSRYIRWEMDNERRRIELAAHQWIALPAPEQNAIIVARYEVKKSC